MPREMGELLTFKALQEETAHWRNANFEPGAKPAWEQLLGVMEEVGELAHAEIKHEQGIRGFTERSIFEEAIKDGVGDLIIFLAGYCSRSCISMQDAVEYAWAQVKNRDWKANPETGEVK